MSGIFSRESKSAGDAARAVRAKPPELQVEVFAANAFIGGTEVLNGLSKHKDVWTHGPQSKRVCQIAARDQRVTLKHGRPDLLIDAQIDLNIFSARDIVLWLPNAGLKFFYCSYNGIRVFTIKFFQFFQVCPIFFPAWR